MDRTRPDIMSTYAGALIVNRAVSNREDGFATRVAENQRCVFQIAYSVLANPADAEEVAQEVFLRAHRRFTALRDLQKFRAWVNRIAFRLALNRQRAHRRQMTRDTAWHAGSVAEDQHRADERLLLDRVRKEIDCLPEKLRVVMLLCAVEEMEAGEVARVLKVPVGTVRSRLHLARKRLLGALQL